MVGRMSWRWRLALLLRLRHVMVHCLLLGGDDELFVLAHQIGDNGLLDLEAAVRLLAAQAHLVRGGWRYENDSILARLQNIRDDELCATIMTRWRDGEKIHYTIYMGILGLGLICCLVLTRCLYLLRLSRALLISRLSSVSSLNETTNALGTHRRTSGASIFGTSCSEMVGAPWPDCILCVGCVTRSYDYCYVVNNNWSRAYMYIVSLTI